MERGIIRFLYGRPLETLLATWGVSLILQQAVRTIFGPTTAKSAIRAWMSGSFEAGELLITDEPALDHCFFADRCSRSCFSS
jgi:urea transport system permease protein